MLYFPILLCMQLSPSFGDTELHYEDEIVTRKVSLPMACYTCICKLNDGFVSFPILWQSTMKDVLATPTGRPKPPSVTAGTRSGLKVNDFTTHERMHKCMDGDILVLTYTYTTVVN